MSTPLTRWIHDRIAEEGPVPFARFMQWALYHPEFGYYTTGQVRVGEDTGDFTTAPHLSRAFARCVARFAVSLDRHLGTPACFTFIEGGPGEGRFARDFLDAVRDDHPQLYPRVRYHLDEISPALARRQQTLLEPHLPQVQAGRPAAPALGIYFSNELVDALPVHRLQQHRGEWREVYVSVQGAELQEVLLPPSSPQLVEACAGLPAVEDCQVEVRPESHRWLLAVSGCLERGCVLTVDYGDEAAALFGPHHPSGTCVGYRGHRQQHDLLATPGQQDLTAQVDFSALRRYGQELGLQSAPLLRQRDFLLATGLIEEVEALEQLDLPEAEKMLLRQSLAPLIMPGTGMGDSFKVLVQARGVPLEALPLDPTPTLPCR